MPARTIPANAKASGWEIGDERDRAAPVGLELLEVGDDHAGLLARHVGEHDVAGRLDRDRRERDDVAHRGRALEHVPPLQSALQPPRSVRSPA